MNKALIAAVIAIAAGATSAQAAGSTAGKPRLAEPMPDWSGFYLGVGLGFRSTDTNANVNSARDTSGPSALPDQFQASGCYAGLACVTGQQMNGANFRFNPYVGYNWQSNSGWLLGIEADAGFGSETTRANGYYPATRYLATPSSSDSFFVKTSWDASLRGRVGYLIDPGLMIYGTAGPAWLHQQSTSNCSTLLQTDGNCSSNNVFQGLAPASITNSKTMLGATVGGGVEAMLSPNWILRGEYRYSDYGTAGNTNLRSGGTGTETVNYDVSVKTHTATFGLAYKFGNAASTSPLASYSAMPTSTTSWSGAYVGAGIGLRANQTTAALDSATVTRHNDPPVNVITDCLCFLDNALNATSVRFNPYIGYNWQFAPKWVVGIEGDFGWANHKSTNYGTYEPGTLFSSDFGQRDSYSIATKWDASLRLRLGYVISPSLMIYGTGGLAAMSIEETSRCDTALQYLGLAPGFSSGEFGNCAPGLRTPVNISKSLIKPGFTIGGGGEAKLWGNWVARVEYRYSDFGTARFNEARSCNGSATILDPNGGFTTAGCFETEVIQSSARLRTNTAMFGLAYTFN
jgi:outer membrane immunogenic protein